MTESVPQISNKSKLQVQSSKGSHAEGSAVVSCSDPDSDDLEGISDKFSGDAEASLLWGILLKSKSKQIPSCRAVIAKKWKYF